MGNRTGSDASPCCGAVCSVGSESACDKRRMLERKIEDNEIYKQAEPLANALGLRVVDVVKSVRPNSVDVAFIVSRIEGEATIDDCEAFHRAIQPILELDYRDELSMSVSTPGLQRILKDVHEFSVFQGRTARVYTSGAGMWIRGLISDVGEDGFTLSGAAAEDAAADVPGDFRIRFEDVQKAKLDFGAEDAKRIAGGKRSGSKAQVRTGEPRIKKTNNKKKKANG